LVKEYPGLTDLLFKLQGAGTGWVRLLQVLEQAVADGGGDHADHSKGNFIHQIFPLSSQLQPQLRRRTGLALPPRDDDGETCWQGGDGQLSLLRTLAALTSSKNTDGAEWLR
jgi:hypothetical protein